MMKQQKVFPFRSLLLLFLLCSLLFGTIGCTNRPTETGGRLQIVCTTFPHYDWMRNIVGDTDNVELTLLIANGTDPHSYEPTIADIATLSDSDMVILVGGESDLWIKEAIANAEEPRPAQITLIDLPNVTLREITSESGHDHGHDHSHGHHDHEHAPYDEHIWLSLQNAVACVQGLTELLAEKDAENADRYRQNAAVYLEKLEALDLRYESMIAAAPRQELLFADRFPFIYLTEDYGLHVHAAFDGCTTDVNASFETILRLIEATSELNVTKIMVTESSDRKLAEAVIRACEETNLEIRSLDSLQSITKQRIEAGETYLSVMEQNLLTLQEALS